MVETRELKKSFNRLEVLRGINARFESGKCTALLGHNGSGKTTLLKSILGLVKPDSGDILLNGQSILKDNQYRKQIGYLPQIAHFPENLKVRELISFISRLRGKSAQPEKFIRAFFLEEHLNKPLRNLSGGSKQKVNATLAMMFDPALYIFDEPTTGLDPVSSLSFKALVKEELERGKTIILTTHILFEVEELCSEMVFLFEGTGLYQGSPADLKKNHQSKTLEQAIAAMLVAENVKTG